MKETIEHFIRDAEPSQMAWGLFGETEGQMEFGLFIREDAEHLARLGEHPLIEIRAGLLQTAVPLVVVMVKVAGELYECWFNLGREEGQDAIRRLSEQERLVLHCSDGEKISRSLRVHWREAQRMNFHAMLARGAGNWTDAQYEQAREKVYQEYPDLESLWRELSDLEFKKVVAR